MILARAMTPAIAPVGQQVPAPGNDRTDALPAPFSVQGLAGEPGTGGVGPRPGVSGRAERGSGCVGERGVHLGVGQDKGGLSVGVVVVQVGVV